MPVFKVNAQKLHPFSFVSSILRHKPMRPVVHLFTQLHVLLYQLTGGKAHIAKYPTLLLSVLRRKTGKLRTIPLIYIPDGERFIIAAAYSGSDQHPSWWLNLRHSQHALVQVMRSRVRVRPLIAAPDERDGLWLRLVAMYPYFAHYKERTQREIPIIILQPVETL